MFSSRIIDYDCNITFFLLNEPVTCPMAIASKTKQTKNPVESITKCVNKIAGQKTDKKQESLVKKKRLTVLSTKMCLKYLQFRVASRNVQ